jgi:hypothetical protein
VDLAGGCGCVYMLHIGCVFIMSSIIVRCSRSMAGLAPAAVQQQSRLLGLGLTAVDLAGGVFM